MPSFFKYFDIKMYFDRKLLVVLFLGFSSGLPLLLTLSTMAFWMTSLGIKKTTIGLFALVGVPYVWKFMWAPALDHLSVPFITKRMGQRRGWLIVIQILLALAIFIMGKSHPETHLLLTACTALSVAFFSATQDIVVDAYRIEILQSSQYTAGAGVAILGYRIGMILSGGFAVMLSDLYSWETVYTIMSLFMSVGIITTLLCKEPENLRPLDPKKATMISSIQNALINPFLEFIKRPYWFVILLFIVSYRLGDNLLGQMTTVFYKELGFSGMEIGAITKALAIWISILGGLLGGSIAFRIGIMQTLLVGAIIHFLANGFFFLLAVQGRSLAYLSLTIGAEHLSAGIMNTAMVAYLSHLCNKQFTATQYALFSSLISLSRIFLQTGSGYIVDQMGWIHFFIIVSLSSVPSIMLWFYLKKKTPISV